MVQLRQLSIRSRNALVVHVHGRDVVLTDLLRPGSENPKIAKGELSGEYLTAALSLAPARTSGYQVCSNASPHCADLCLNTSGNGRFDATQIRRIARTLACFQHRDWFFRRLRADLTRFQAEADCYGLTLAVRLNTFSDLQWEKIVPTLFEEFPRVQFYDYTKHPQRMKAGALPSNYYLTFSRSEKNGKDCLRVLAEGGNVAVVFKSTPERWERDRPRSWNGYPVIDGERTDLRFTDPFNVVVGLLAKGRAWGARGVRGGFVVGC